MKRIYYIVITMCLLLKINAQIAIDTLNQVRDFSNCIITGTSNSTLTMQSANFSPLSFTLAIGDYKKIKLPIYSSIITYDSILVLITSAATASINLTIDNPSPFMPPYNLSLNQTSRYAVFNTNTVDLPIITTSFTGTDISSIGIMSLTKILILGFRASLTNIIDEKDKSSSFIMFPNPANEFLTINSQMTEALEFTTINITNTLGEVVSSSVVANTQNFTLKTNNLISGVYFIKMYNKQKLLCTKKFIKQ